MSPEYYDWIDALLQKGNILSKIVENIIPDDMKKQYGRKDLDNLSRHMGDESPYKESLSRTSRPSI